MKKKTVVGVVVGALAVLVVASFSYVAARNAQPVDEYGYRPVESAPQKQAKAVPAGELEETTLQVSKLSCGSCLYTIETELKKFDGMVGMKADLGSGLVLVSHTKEFPSARIASVITETGYPAQVVDAKKAGDLLKKSGSGSGSSGCGGCGPRGCSYPTAPPQQG